MPRACIWGALLKTAASLSLYLCPHGHPSAINYSERICGVQLFQLQPARTVLGGIWRLGSWYCGAAAQLYGQRLPFWQKKDYRERNTQVKKIIKSLAKQPVLWVREGHLKLYQRLQVLMFLMSVLLNFYWPVKFSLQKKLHRQNKHNYYNVISINKDS